MRCNNLACSTLSNAEHRHQLVHVKRVASVAQSDLGEHSAAEGEERGHVPQHEDVNGDEPCRLA